jgi:hypothetical protein
MIGVKESVYWIYKDNLKWFATKEEAEKFSNVLTGKVDAFARVRVVDTEVAKIPKYVAGQRGTMEGFNHAPTDPWMKSPWQEEQERQARQRWRDMQGAVIIPPPNWSIVPLDEYPITEEECYLPKLKIKKKKLLLSSVQDVVSVKSKLVKTNKNKTK